MKPLLVHTSDVDVPVLRPSKIHDGDTCICFSEDCFIPHFGQYLYIFEKEVLEAHFHVLRCATGGVNRYHSVSEPLLGGCHTTVDYHFRGESLGYECRIYDPVDVQRYALGVLKFFDTLKGELKTVIEGKVIEREMIRREQQRGKP